MVIAGAVLLPMWLAAQATAPVSPTGWSFSYDIRRTDTVPSGTPAGDLAFDVTVWRGRALVVVRSGPMRAMTGDQGSILVLSGDSVLTIINPQRREVLKLSAGQSASGPMAGMPSPALTVSDARRVVTPSGAGPQTEGYATQRVRVEEAYTMSVSTPGGPRSVRTTNVIDLLVSPAVLRLDPGFRAFADHFISMLGQPPAVRARMAATSRARPAGFPVRSASTIRIESDGQQGTSTVAGTMRSLRRIVVDTSRFVVPASYRVTEMSRLLQQRRSPGN